MRDATRGLCDTQAEGQGRGVQGSFLACINHSIVGVGDFLQESFSKGRLPQGQRDGKWLPREESFFLHINELTDRRGRSVSRIHFEWKEDVSAFQLNYHRENKQTRGTGEPRDREELSTSP